MWLQGDLGGSLPYRSWRWGEPGWRVGGCAAETGERWAAGPQLEAGPWLSDVPLGHLWGFLGQRLGVRASVSHLYEAEGAGATGVLSPGRYMVPAHQEGRVEVEGGGWPGQDPSPGFWLPRARLHGRSPGAYWADASPWAVECGFLLSHWTPPALPRQTCPLGGPHALYCDGG